jgi:hypothetical protein
MFFSWGVGGGEEETPGHVFLSRFRRTTRVSEQSCYILHIEQWGFRFNMSQTISNGVPDPRCLGQTRVLVKFRQPDDLLHSLKTVKGLLHFVPTQTPHLVRVSSYMLFNTYMCMYIILQ